MHDKYIFWLIITSEFPRYNRWNLVSRSRHLISKKRILTNTSKVPRCHWWNISIEIFNFKSTSNLSNFIGISHEMRPPYVNWRWSIPQFTPYVNWRWSLPQFRYRFTWFSTYVNPVILTELTIAFTSIFFSARAIFFSIFFRPFFLFSLTNTWMWIRLFEFRTLKSGDRPEGRGTRRKRRHRRSATGDRRPATPALVERDCFYYIIVQTYDVGLHSRRHPMEFDAGTRPFASLDAPSS